MQNDKTLAIPGALRGLEPHLAEMEAVMKVAQPLAEAIRSMERSGLDETLIRSLGNSPLLEARY